MVLEGGEATALLLEATILALVLTPTKPYDLGPN